MTMDPRSEAQRARQHWMREVERDRRIYGNEDDWRTPIDWTPLRHPPADRWIVCGTVVLIFAALMWRLL